MTPLSRRQLLQAGGFAAAAGLAGCSSGHPHATPTPRATVTSFPPPRTLTLRTTVQGSGSYAYLPFDVPPGVDRVEVSVAKSDPGAKLGAGLFDSRGTGYQSAGFRGIYGEERSSFFVSAAGASQSFLPGPVEPGRWTVVVPVFLAPARTTVTATVRLTGGPATAAFRAGAPVGTVLDQAGWYRGDLHCHTPESSDAWKSGTALTPAEWADSCRDTGLDFVAMTDHNVVSQNLHLAADAGSDVLLLPGEEMTNWFYGHATVSGIPVGAWLDFRQAPEGTPLPGDGARLREFLHVARGMGAYVSAAHPSAGSIRWQFQPEMATPASRTDGYEVWCGPFQPDDRDSVAAWDAMLRRGWRVHANGGSDLHGTDNIFGNRVGTPTTVVYAASLSTPDVVAALRAGRSFITRRPDGVECYLTATRAEQAAYVGGAVYGDVGDPVTVTALVRGGAGFRLELWSGGQVVATTPLTADVQTVQRTVRIPAGGGYVRAEVHGATRTYDGRPLALELDMECLTNPIWLTVGDPPAGAGRETAPPPAKAGPRRARRPGLGDLPPGVTGAAAVVAGVAALTAPPEALSLEDYLLRAGAGVLGERSVRLVGQLLPAGLTRRVPDCCAPRGRAVSVPLIGVTAPVGSWLAVVGRPAGAALDVTSERVLPAPLPVFER